MNENYSVDESRSHTAHLRPRSGLLKNPSTPPDEAMKAPVCVRFILADGQHLDASARRYLVLGRQDGYNSQQIDVDFGQSAGREYGVSRCHAIIQVMGNIVRIKDFNSRNGTYLNGYELHPMRLYPLNDGDELALGRITMQVQFIY